MAKSKWSKDIALSHWKGLKPGAAIMPHMDVIPYQAQGSTYGACGIRIDGNPAFIDAVLSRLKDLIAGEGIETRLGLARREVEPVTIKGSTKHFGNTSKSAEVCYIRLHERGGEAIMCNAFVAGMMEHGRKAS